MTFIVKVAFRKLEEIIKDFNHNITPINSNEERILRAPLTNCDKWLPPVELEAYKTLIKVSCHLIEDMNIPPYTAVSLYNYCIKQLHQRMSDPNIASTKGRGRKKASSYLISEAGSDQTDEYLTNSAVYELENPHI